MKKFALAAAALSVALVGCASKDIQDSRAMVLEGEAVEVKVVNIRSFQVEVAPRKAVCQVTDTAGNKMDAECLQYRQLHQSNFNTLSGDIQGFEYEPGYRYVLDLKQEALLNETTNKVVPVWSLNKVVSKTSEQLPQ